MKPWKSNLSYETNFPHRHRVLPPFLLHPSSDNISSQRQIETNWNVKRKSEPFLYRFSAPFISPPSSPLSKLRQWNFHFDIKYRDKAPMFAFFSANSPPSLLSFSVNKFIFFDDIRAKLKDSKFYGSDPARVEKFMRNWHETFEKIGKLDPAELFPYLIPLLAKLV